MKLGLVVKLRPAGPWRIGPDSGARNRVDVIYHSDSLYSAVTSAMARMGMLEEWLDATARTATPAVCFSSSFPYLDEITFVVPPRTLWPPASRGLATSRVRWKSARFVPITVVKAILAGERLNENQWSVDGASGCLVPVGRPGPFRTGIRWSAAVDRLTGASERHSTACIEFRPGCGFWTIAGFADEAARDQWQDPVKAAFRLLADTGFGGERSRGWGRSETPEFSEGLLPEMIIETAAPRAERQAELPETAPAAAEPEPVVAEEAVAVEAEAVVADQGWQAEPPAPPTELVVAEEVVAQAVSPAVELPEAAPAAAEPEPAVADQGWQAEAPALPVAEEVVAQAVSPAAESPEAEPAAAEPEPAVAEEALALEVEPALSDAPISAVLTAPDRTVPLRLPSEPAAPSPALQAHWMLSLFTPAAADAVDWARGNYTVLARGGRVDSPSGSGELKKQIQMVAEGSVIYADGVPLGAAPDVAPDGFAHPVFRAGFALTIPLPEVH